MDLRDKAQALKGSEQEEEGEVWIVNSVDLCIVSADKHSANFFKIFFVVLILYSY